MEWIFLIKTSILQNKILSEPVNALIQNANCLSMSLIYISLLKQCLGSGKRAEGGEMLKMQGMEAEFSCTVSYIFLEFTFTGFVWCVFHYVLMQNTPLCCVPQKLSSISSLSIYKSTLLFSNKLWTQWPKLFFIQLHMIKSKKKQTVLFP
jgi:hypothetical protein